MNTTHKPCRYTSSQRLLGLLVRVVAPLVLLPQCARPRPLTARERDVSFVGGDRLETARLNEDCLPVGTVRHVDSSDDARRRAGEQRAQVVQNLQHHAALQVITHVDTGETTSTETDAGFDARFWQCPAASPPQKGEVVWRMREPVSFLGVESEPSFYDMEILRDGAVVSRGRDGFAGLSHALADYPPAASLAESAERSGRSAKRGQRAAVASALVLLASTGVAATGLATRNEPYGLPLLIGGGGGMVVSLSVLMGAGVHHGNAGGESATAAMDAIDRYDEELFGGSELPPVAEKHAKSARQESANDVPPAKHPQPQSAEGSSTSELIRRAAAEGEAPRVRLEAIAELGSRRDDAEESVPVLIALIAEPKTDASVHVAAVSALGSLGPTARAAVPALIDEMSQPERKTVEIDGEEYAAATSLALEKITGQQFGRDAERWRRWVTENPDGASAGRSEAGDRVGGSPTGAAEDE